LGECGRDDRRAGTGRGERATARRGKGERRRRKVHGSLRRREKAKTEKRKTATRPYGDTTVLQVQRDGSAA